MYERKIIHIDMDAFYAAVEQRDFPELRGKPVIVGGQPNSRGVVSTASYEARKFGVHSAMPSSKAYRLCPQGIFVYPRFEVYIEVSRQILEIFFSYTDLVEPLSLDEAFLDITGTGSATLLALEIKKRIFDTTGLTASAGVSYCKFLAKVASDYKKPNGLTVIPPEKAEEFLENLPIGKFFGVGKVTEKRMKEFGIHTGKDLKAFTREELSERFGKSGSYYYDIVRGIDDRPVSPERERKSYGKERTFEKDMTDVEEMKDFLRKIAGRVSEGMKKKPIVGKTVTLKVRFANFQRITRSKTIDEPTNDPETMYRIAADLLENHTPAGKRRVRLLGISMSGLTGNVRSTAKDQIVR